MEPKLMEILACPVCKGKLDLMVTAKKGEEIVTGSLFCPKCGVKYPIQDCIPNLLPPPKTP